MARILLVSGSTTFKNELVRALRARARQLQLPQPAIMQVNNQVTARKTIARDNQLDVVVLDASTPASARETVAIPDALRARDLAAELAANSNVYAHIIATGLTQALVDALLEAGLPSGATTQNVADLAALAIPDPGKPGE